jgi:hypothetical protein
MASPPSVFEVITAREAFDRGARKYPVDTPARAANAKARASQQVAKGDLSSSAAGKIDAKGTDLK